MDLTFRAKYVSMFINKVLLTDTEGKMAMTGRERVLKALRCRKPDRVPYDIDGFNREAFRLFKEKTGSDDPDTYFGVEKDVAWVGPTETSLNLKERFLKFHDLREEDYRKVLLDIPTEGLFTLNEWGPP